MIYLFLKQHPETTAFAALGGVGVSLANINAVLTTISLILGIAIAVAGFIKVLKGNRNK